MTGSNSHNSNRPTSPTGVASRDHPSGCTCGCWHTDLPKPLYRQYQGTEVFTGILLMDSNNNLFKLNDPNFLGFQVGDTIADLAGHGHVMTDQEFILEMSQYYDRRPRNDNSLPTIKNAVPYFRDYADKPHDLGSWGVERLITPEEIEHFSTIFPHGIPSEQYRWTTPQVRAHDSVKVMLYKYIPEFGQDATERIWVDVLAVTSTGMLVGTVNSSIDNPVIVTKNFPMDMSPDPNFDLHEDDLVAFPVTCAYGVKHGDNW